MQIVIEIDEEYFKQINESVKSGNIDYEPWVAIANGTPLPQGNWVSIDEEPHETFECNNCGNVMCAVYDISDYKYCPNCGAEMKGEEEC